MKSMKLKRLVSVLLSIVMVFGLVYISAPSAYAEDNVTWPQITKESITIDQSKWAWNHVTSDFTTEFIDYKVIQYTTLEGHEHPKSTADKPLYEVGIIELYFTALPTASQRQSDSAGLNCKQGSIVVNVDKINWNGTVMTDGGDNFNTKTAAQAYWKNGNYEEYSYSGTTYTNAKGFVIQSGDTNIKYSYKIRLVEYTDAGSLKLSESSFNRNSKQSATIVFTSSGAGTYWYSVYDTKQENPEFDTEGYTLNENTNTLSIVDLNSYSEKYVYIKGNNGSVDSNILEVTIPAFTFPINHDVKYLDGFTFYNNDGVPYLGYFYSEYFTDTDGNKITEAVPGDTVKVVFNANGGTIQERYTLTEDDLIVGYAKSYKLDGWQVSGVEVDGSSISNQTEFSFIMPESNVSVNANLVLSGAKIKFKSNIPAPGIPNSLAWDYYSIFSDKWTSMAEYIIPEGQQEYEDTFKTGLKFRANEYFKPGLDIGAYVLKEIKIFNNGTNLNPSDDVLYDTGFTLQEGDNYEFRFVFRDKAYALITTDSNDPTMGTASASVNSTTLVYEGETVTLTATPNEGYVLKEWQVKDDNGTTIPVTIDSEDPNKASFVMTADYSDEITATAVFEAEALPSSECELTSVTLTGGGNTYTAEKNGTDFTITLPAGTDVSSLAQWPLTLEISEGATVAKNGDATWTNGAACGMALNTPVTFTVTAEDGATTQEYTIEIVMDGYIAVTFNHTCLVQNSLAIAFKAGGVDWSEYSDIYLHIERQAYAKNDPECTWRIEDIRDYTIDDRGRCVFTYSGISAAEMGDQIKATVYATKDGKEYVSNTDTYSIATYAYNTLENYKDNAALRTLLVDMLNYGSEAQTYFGKNVGNLVNAALTETQKSWATPGSISYENCKADGTFAGATARVSSRSLVLEETVKLKAYMTFDTTPGSNVKVVFRYTAASGQEKVTEVNSKDFVYDSAKNRYSAMLTTIAPPDFKKPISIKIYDGSTQISAEYTYSVESYAYSASQWEGSQYDALKTLVSAMIKYSRAAEAYFQQIQ